MPGHKIPEPFKWDESFKVFYESLDEEHRGLFDGIFDCCEDRGNKGKLDTLYGKVEAHFTTEETMMKAKDYVNLTAHKGEHDKFLSTLQKLSVPLDDKTVDFAKGWLVNHIKDSDFGYKGKL